MSCRVGDSEEDLLLGQLFYDAGAGGKRALDKVADMVANFGYGEIDALGHIPNGNRTYYLGWAAAFLAFMVELLAQHEGDDALKEYLPQLQVRLHWMEALKFIAAAGQQNQLASSNWKTIAFSALLGRSGYAPPESGLKISLPHKSN